MTGNQRLVILNHRHVLLSVLEAGSLRLGSGEESLPSFLTWQRERKRRERGKEGKGGRDTQREGGRGEGGRGRRQRVRVCSGVFISCSCLVAKLCLTPL